MHFWPFYPPSLCHTLAAMGMGCACFGWRWRVAFALVCACRPGYRCPPGSTSPTAEPCQFGYTSPAGAALCHPAGAVPLRIPEWDFPLSYGVSGITAVAYADITGDGVPEVFFGLGGEPAVSLLLYNRDMSENDTLPTNTAYGVHALAVADFNGDSFPDIVTLGQRTEGASVLEFRPSYLLPTTDASASSLVLSFGPLESLDTAVYMPPVVAAADCWLFQFETKTGDWDGDGDVDLAIVQIRSGNTSMWVAVFCVHPCTSILAGRPPVLRAFRDSGAGGAP